MRKIYLYRDEGVDQLGLTLLQIALKEHLDQTHSLYFADRHLLQSEDWEKDTDLLIFPGGRDIPYHQALQGQANLRIANFVKQGGAFLGICAGAYYASHLVEFEKGGPLEVLAERELRFFPGIAKGPAYGLRKFCYQSNKGMQIAKLKTPSFMTAAYYNGGCVFTQAEEYASVSVLAHYDDIEYSPPAIIKCQVGLGRAVLCGVHPEYSGSYSPMKDHLEEKQLFALKEIEEKRQALFTYLLQELQII